MSYNQKPTSPGTFIFKHNFISVSGYTERRDIIGKDTGWNYYKSFNWMITKHL